MSEKKKNAETIDAAETIEMLEALVENAKRTTKAAEDVRKYAERAERATEGAKWAMERNESSFGRTFGQNAQKEFAEAVIRAVDGNLGQERAKLARQVESYRRVAVVATIAVAVVAGIAVLAMCFCAAATTGSLDSWFWRLCTGIGLIVIIAVVAAIFISMH